MKKLLVFVVLFAGCGRVVYIPHGQAVQLRQEVKNCKVWVKDKDGNIIPSKMDIPEGWFCLPKDE